MIAQQCPKCKSIGCNNNNVICNNWNDQITWSTNSTSYKTINEDNVLLNPAKREFKLNSVEEERLVKFYEKCKKKTKGEDVHLSYHFYPTGIGDTIIVRSETLGIEKEITDVDSW